MMSNWCLTARDSANDRKNAAGTSEPRESNQQVGDQNERQPHFQPWESGPGRLIMYRATVDSRPRSRRAHVLRIDIDQFSDTIDSKVESSSNLLAPSTTALSGSLLIDTGRPISLLM
jgi:hypothetical protein